MRRRALSAFVLVWPVALAGCGGCGHAPGAPDAARDGGDRVPLVLAWTVRSAHWGTEAILVKRDGRARYLLDPPPGSEGAHLRGALTLSAEELDALGRLFEESRVCELRSARAGKPDESRPTLDLDFPGARCTVTMFFDEWRETPAALPSAGAIAHLRERLRQQALH